MKEDNNLIRVGFTTSEFGQWWGGITYLRNLFYAIYRMNERKIWPVVFWGQDIELKTLSLSEPCADIVRDSAFDLGKAKWFVTRALDRLTGRDYYLERILAKNQISVISHLLYGVKGTRDFKTIGWIPDFQHLHLPEMFSNRELARRNRIYAAMARKNDIIILSSHDALKDFAEFAPAYAHKGRVLHFVAQPSRSVYEMDSRATEQKFGIDRKYFFLPNQFWKHKNHRVVFDAVKILKDRGAEVLIVCCGLVEDYRNRAHVAELRALIRTRGLQDRIKLLGMIDETDLFYLMRNSISLLNPSLFEGWSTTVEEAKSIGKSVILSDIAVHREQNPPGGVFFDPDNAEELASILQEKYGESEGGPDLVLEEQARKSLSERSALFGHEYQRIVLKLYANLAEKGNQKASSRD